MEANQQKNVTSANQTVINRALLEVIPDLLLRVRRDGQCLDYILPRDANSEKFLPIQRHLSEILSTAALTLWLQAIERALATGKLQIFEHQINKYGQLCHEQVRIVACGSDEVLAIVRDVSHTQRDEVESGQITVEPTQPIAGEQELRQIRARFLSVISHEFRTPLTTIQTAIDLLQSFDMTEAERTELFNQIHGAVKQTTQIMESVLLLGQAEAAQLSLNLSWCDLKQLCQKIIRAAEINTARTIQLTINQGNQHDQVYLDEKLIHHILDNLLSNALKYSPAGSAIQVGLTITANAVTIQVHDDGIGIPAEEKPHLFNFFYRASNVGAVPGAGVGLAIVKHCVELHGGQVTVESKTGQGTTFVVHLPTK